MNKRSAMIVSASLIVILIAGAWALTLGLTRPTSPASAGTNHVKHTPTAVHKKDH